MSGTYFPSTPPGWRRSRAGRWVRSRPMSPTSRRTGPLSRWSSRGHRKHASLFSRRRGRRERVHQAARHASWWIGILFAAGSVCFLFAPMPWFCGWSALPLTARVLRRFAAVHLGCCPAVVRDDQCRLWAGHACRAVQGGDLRAPSYRLVEQRCAARRDGVLQLDHVPGSANQRRVVSRTTSSCGGQTRSARSASLSPAISPTSRCRDACGRAPWPDA